jgi:predicted transposase YdaD
VLEKSFFYQEILQKGREEGRLQERLSGIALGLEVKFGAEGLQLMPQISQITDLEQLKIIQRGVLTVKTLNELVALIQTVPIATN